MTRHLQPWLAAAFPMVLGARFCLYGALNRFCDWPREQWEAWVACQLGALLRCARIAEGWMAEGHDQLICLAALSLPDGHCKVEARYTCDNICQDHITLKEEGG